jgi:hypothetical protein
MKSRYLLLMLLALLFTTVSAQATILFALSGDDFGTPRRVNQIDTSTMTVTTLFDLGDGSIGFFGLTYANDRFYTMGDDGSGASTLHSFTLAGAGATTALFGLGSGFYGGIAAASNNQLYALANDFSGASQLYSVDLAATSSTLIDPTLGFGLAGGLTWNADDSHLYALGSDDFFVQTLFAIDPLLIGSSAAASGPLGSGIIGGLDYSSDGFYAIGAEFGPSSLLSLSPPAAGTTPLFPLAPFPSYTFSALTNAPVTGNPPPPPVPAPPVLWLLLPGLLLMQWRSRTG